MAGTAGSPRSVTGVQGSRRDLWVLLAAVAVALVAAAIVYFGQVTPPRLPSLTLTLAAGCDRVYYPGEMLDIQIVSSLDGQVDVYWTDPDGRREWLFRQAVLAGATAQNEWPVRGIAGAWTLEASLDDGRARAECNFIVDTEFGVLYDFIREAQKASWSVFAPHTGTLTFNGPISSSLGFAGWHNNAVLEDGSRVGRVLETRPPWMPYAEIWGRYDLSALTFQPGDRFSGRVALLHGAYWGDVIFRVQIHDGALGSAPIFAASVPDKYLGDFSELWIRDLRFPLPYALSDKFFYLQVDGGSVPRYDRALWIEARIERPSTGTGE